MSRDSCIRVERGRVRDVFFVYSGRLFGIEIGTLYRAAGRGDNFKYFDLVVFVAHV